MNIHILCEIRDYHNVNVWVNVCINIYGIMSSVIGINFIFLIVKPGCKNILILGLYVLCSLLPILVYQFYFFIIIHDIYL